MNSRWFSIISYVNIYQRVGCPAGSRINKPDGKSMEILDSIELLHGWSALPTYPRKKRYLQEIDNSIPEIIIFGEHQLKSPNVNLSVFFMNNGGLTLFPCVHVLGKYGQTTVSTYAKIRSMSLHSGSTTSKSSGSEFFEKRSGVLRAIRKNTSPKNKHHLALRSDCDFGWFMLIFWRECH